MIDLKRLVELPGCGPWYLLIFNDSQPGPAPDLATADLAAGVDQLLPGELVHAGKRGRAHVCRSVNYPRCDCSLRGWWSLCVRQSGVMSNISDISKPGSARTFTGVRGAAGENYLK